MTSGVRMRFVADASRAGVVRVARGDVLYPVLKQALPREARYSRCRHLVRASPAQRCGVEARAAGATARRNVHEQRGGVARV